MIKLDRSKIIHYRNFEDIKVGDIVFLDCDGPCSGGALYGIGDAVAKIDTRYIYIKDQMFSRMKGTAESKPWAYYISFWQRG